MCMDIHEANLAAEEGGRFGAAENALWPAAVGHRPIHEPHAVGIEQVQADELKVMPRLVRREELSDDALRHRQQRITQSCPAIARVEQRLRRPAARIEK